MTDELTKILGTMEPLDPALARWRFNDGLPMIKHPLVYDHDMPPLYALSNKRLAVKRKMLRKARATRDFHRAIFCYERAWRLYAFKAIMRRLPPATYWDLLGDVYNDSENVWQNYGMWKRLLTRRVPGRLAIMTDRERMEYFALPDVLTIYRGVHGGHADGLSWTLDRERAIWFATRWKQPRPTLFTGTVRKADIIGYFSRRNESEVVTLWHTVGDERSEPL